VKLAKTHEFDAEVMSVGVWNKDKFTDKDLESMVANFEALKESIKPPVKLGHNEKQIKDGQPAIGWVKSLKKVGTKLIATLTQVPDVIMRAIQSGRYKRISSEVYWNYKHAGETFSKVLAGVALLGADIPAVDNLEDLEAFLSQSTSKGSFDSLKAYAFETDEAGKIINTDKKEFTEMNEQEYQAKLAKLEQEKEDAEKKAEQEMAEKKQYADRLAKQEQEAVEAKQRAEVEGITAHCEEMVKAGKMLPYQRDLIVTDLEKRTYSKDDGHIFDFEMIKKIFEKVDKILVTDEKAHDKKKTFDVTDPAELLSQKTKEYMQEHPDVTYEDASNIVLQKDPKLAEAYAKDEGGEK